MSRPEAAPEPSMDDILASIRKIIAEEPAAVRPPPEPRGVPLDARPSALSSLTVTSTAVPQSGNPIGQPQRQPEAAPAQSVDAQSAPQPRAAMPPQVEPSGAPLTANSLARALNGLSTAPAPLSAPADLAMLEPKGGPAAGHTTPLDDLADLLEEAPASPFQPSQPAQSSPAAASMAAGSRLFAKPEPQPAATAEPARASSSPSLGSAFGTAMAATPADRAAPAPTHRISDVPRSFDELLRSRPGSERPSGATPSKLDLDAAPPPAVLGDLGSVVPTRQGFGAPPVETALAAPATPRAPSVSRAPESPPFGASVLKGAVPVAANPAAKSPAMPQSATSPVVAAAPDNQPWYEVIAAMPSPAVPNTEVKDVEAVAARDVAEAISAPVMASPAPHQAADAATPLAKLMPVTVSAPPVDETPVADVLGAGVSAPESRGAEIDQAFDLDIDSGEAGFEAAAIESTAAAASALGALAAGLAASSKGMMPPLAAPAPAVSAEPAARSLPAPEPIPAKAPARVLPSFEASLASMTAPAAPKVTHVASVPVVEQAVPMVAVAAPEPAPAPVVQAPVSTVAEPSVTVTVGSARPAASEPALPVAAESVLPVAAESAAPVAPAASAAPSPAPVSGVSPLAPGSGVSPLAPGSGAVPVRSLDDTVADLLRPMLRQWLSDNMPRIVEKALRIEVAERVRSVIPPAKSD